MRILLVEDEKRLADPLAYVLKKHHYSVDTAYDGVSAQDKAETGIYDLIILDWMLPMKSGVEVLRDLRRQKIQSAVLLLTAKDTIKNKIEGFDAGADDYLVKPFSNDELLARLKALSRRIESISNEDNLRIGTLALDTTQCEVSSIEKKVIKLSLQEMHLLEFLIRNKEQVLSKEQILDKVWGFDKDVDISNVELYIYYLRKKIDFEKSGVSLSTIRGVGYCLKEV